MQKPDAPEPKDKSNLLVAVSVVFTMALAVVSGSSFIDDSNEKRATKNTPMLFASKANPSAEAQPK